MALAFTFVVGFSPLLGAEGADSIAGHSEDSIQVSAPLNAQPQGSVATASEPEEPDFAFIAGGPYTQKKTSPQFIFPVSWGRRSTTLSGARTRSSEFGALLRGEYGITDRWELDVILSASGERLEEGGQRLASTFALSDTVVGARYRLLQESSAPITLTIGPQIIIPTGSFRSGTGNSATGVAWDVAGAKDWGGPVFVYASANYSFFPSVRPETAGGPQHFPLHNIFAATALGLRPLEINRGRNHHDIHAFLEWGVGREEGLEFGPVTQKAATTVFLFAPGIRYGLLTAKSKLIEIGVSFPIGLNQATPRGGIVVQLQIENLFGYQED